MTPVLVKAASAPTDARRLIESANRAQTCYRFEPASAYAQAAEPPHAPGRRVPLTIRHEPLHGLFVTSRSDGVEISTDQSLGRCQYAGLEIQEYLLLCALLGLTQWSVLEGNPLIQPEDFSHSSEARCLFAALDVLEDYALLLESPWVCPGCTQFYHCLGADSEFQVLRDLLGRLSPRPA